MGMETAWAEQGIVGRGILVDLARWREKQSDPAVRNFDCFQTSPIPLAHLQACLQDQGTEVKFGDILFIRTGKSQPQPSRPRPRPRPPLHPLINKRIWHKKHTCLIPIPKNMYHTYIHTSITLC